MGGVGSIEYFSLQCRFTNIAHFKNHRSGSIVINQDNDDVVRDRFNFKMHFWTPLLRKYCKEKLVRKYSKI
jgi:hypothetical protein